MIECHISANKPVNLALLHFRNDANKEGDKKKKDTDPDILVM